MLAGQFNLADNAELELELAQIMGETAEAAYEKNKSSTKSANAIANSDVDALQLPRAPSGPIVVTFAPPQTPAVAEGSVSSVSAARQPVLA